MSGRCPAFEAEILKTVLLATLLLLPAVPLVAAEPEAVYATLLVNAGHAAAPGWRECEIHVATASNVGHLLDQAVAQGCILEWDSATFPGFGRYVTSIDHLTEAFATYWAFRVDGAYSSTGIDHTPVVAGKTYQFTYEQWAVQL